MIGRSHLQLCKKNSCSVKLQGGPLDYNPRKIPVENSWMIILQNNSTCLYLNDKQMPDEILLSLLQLLDEIQNTKMMKTQESKERKFEKKVTEIGWVVVIFICFWNTFHLLCLTATTFMKSFMKSFRKYRNNIRLGAFRLFLLNIE